MNKSDIVSLFFMPCLSGLVFGFLQNKAFEGLFVGLVVASVLGSCILLTNKYGKEL